MAEDLKVRFSVKQIQLAVGVGLELGSSRLQVQHSNCLATLPPSKSKTKLILIFYVGGGKGDTGKGKEFDH